MQARTDDLRLLPMNDPTSVLSGVAEAVLAGAGNDLTVAKKQFDAALSRVAQLQLMNTGKSLRSAQDVVNMSPAWLCKKHQVSTHDMLGLAAKEIEEILARGPVSQSVVAAQVKKNKGAAWQLMHRKKDPVDLHGIIDWMRAEKRIDWLHKGNFKRDLTLKSTTIVAMLDRLAGIAQQIAHTTTTFARLEREIRAECVEHDRTVSLQFMTFDYPATMAIGEAARLLSAIGTTEYDRRLDIWKSSGVQLKRAKLQTLVAVADPDDPDDPPPTPTGTDSPASDSPGSAAPAVSGTPTSAEASPTRAEQLTVYTIILSVRDRSLVVYAFMPNRGPRRLAVPTHQSDWRLHGRVALSPQRPRLHPHFPAAQQRDCSMIEYWI